MTHEELEKTARDLAIARQGLQATSLFLCEIAFSLADAMKRAAEDQREAQRRKPKRKARKPRPKTSPRQ